MKILRIVDVFIKDSSNIDIVFTENLNTNIITSNISILSESINVPNSEILSIQIIENTLSIVCQPLTSFSPYFIKLISLPLYPFISLHGEAKISEDEISNKYFITGPIPPDDIVKNYFLSYFKDNLYNIDDSNSIVIKYINSLSVLLSKTLYDIRQVKNENYLSFTVTDEKKIRGEGPFDRLVEESAYEIIRIGKTPTNSNSKLTFIFESFPSYPITLQKQEHLESIKVNSIDLIGYFNTNNLIFNLKNNVTKVKSIIFTLNSASSIYTYDLLKFGYQIKNSRYDQDNASSYLSLLENQVKINNKILDDVNFSLSNILKIDIIYESKNLGRVIDAKTLSVTSVFNSIRETIPSIVNIFNLKNAPVVDTNGNIPTIGFIFFTDPNNIIGSNHPAFIIEIPFRLNSLPFLPGQYSIDYATGTVYVFGNDFKNDGTGPYPPLVTYNYKFTYKQEQDYIYDNDLLDIVSLPFGILLDSKCNISFNYEEVLINSVDYNIDLHKEELNERINNNLLSLNVIKAKNSQITNVFKIYNETSSEIYNITRWNDNKIYFEYNNPPVLEQIKRERAIFQTINNELLFIDTSLINESSIIIYKILLNNNNIISSTEDSLGSSVNTSLIFSNSFIFVKEKWFNRQLDEINNINKIKIIGEYIVDYTNGIIYCSSNINIGTVSYKSNKIIPVFIHLISVDDIYYQINMLNFKNKKFSYSSFKDGEIILSNLDNSDEMILNNNDLAIYQILSSKVGTFSSLVFIPGITNQIKFIRGIYEFNDLSNSSSPLNFANVSECKDFNIKIGPIKNKIIDKVQFDGTNYYVIINENIPYFSENILYSFSIIRTSDSLPLWDNFGIIIPGESLKLILPGVNSPIFGETVNIEYSFSIVDLSRIIIDYNKGDLYIDYTSLTDEIIVSYEYGDNIIDFRKNKNLAAGDTYYVSYKIGALRDALLQNFGNLINIPELTNFDISLDRERYRDILTAALSSFIQGPTLSAVKNIGKTISHIEPEIIESVFQNWSLGESLLNSRAIKTFDIIKLIPSKFDNGVLINSQKQNINFPMNSNLRLEEGTFETWINPLWDGLDNNAKLTFNILKDGYLIDPSFVFIGASEAHPDIINNNFYVTKLSEVIGTPNKNKDGIFIFYDNDISGNFKRWYVEIIDGYGANYKCKIISNGYFYDVKTITIPKPSNLTLFTGINKVDINIINDGYINECISFLSDIDYYILDFGEDQSKNRLSIFKDTSGYLNFKVYDKNRTVYQIGADISFWRSGDSHHVAASWKIGTKNNKDEMHLFIDGFEVPNIIKSGQKLKPYLHEKFRAINSEEIIGLINRDIIASIDLQTTIGNNVVTSSINFSSYNIFIGDTIFIDELNFSTLGYSIIGIDGQNLILSSSMPQTLTNGRFSINRSQFSVDSDIDIASNFTVNTIHPFIIGIDINGSIGSNILTSILINFSIKNVKPGYLIRIDDNSLKNVYTILQVTGNSILIDDNLPINIININFLIYNNIENEIPGLRAIRPSYSINDINNNLTISNNIFAGDLLIIRTLGLNNKRIKSKYYIWSDNVENILMTALPPPISLKEVKVTKIILSDTLINLNNSSLGGSILTSNNISTDQPSNSQNGRTLSISIFGTNINFSTPVLVTINGLSGISIINEVLIFNDYGTKDTSNMYLNINYINITIEPINLNKTAAILSVKEKYSITYNESSAYFPVIKYSNVIANGNLLENNGINSVIDKTKLFSYLDINNYLIISSPINVAGFYKITSLSEDRKTLFITPTNAASTLPIPSFNNGIYVILNVNGYRTGLQNGFFTFEISSLPGQAYFLNKGFYEIEYSTYTQIKFDPLSTDIYIGNDMFGVHPLNGILDQVKIYSVMLKDTRIGEDIPINQRSITKDFNSLKPLKKDKNTLMLVNFNNLPFVNDADFYVSEFSNIKKHFHSSLVINDNFGESLVILNDAIKISNDGILDTKKEGSIEFWISPLFDTANDYNKRFYFDAFGAISSEVISNDNISILFDLPIEKVLSVKLKDSSSNIDYYSGGQLEINTKNAIQEETVSISNNEAITSKSILQIISIKIIGDVSNTDYFAGGSIGLNLKTIYLGKILPQNNISLSIIYQTTEDNNKNINKQIIRLNKKLPYQKSNVIVNYIPKGLQGDRLSIFKDEVGYINFAITASNIDYVIRGPTLWTAGTWHRIKVSYKINNGPNIDEMRLFLDGYQYNNVVFGKDLIFGISPIISGAIFIGDGYGSLGNIEFKDPINELFIGSQYNNESPIFSLIDNLKISNISRPIYAPYGEPLDVNFSSNLNMVFPVVEDLYTTYLLNSDLKSKINTDFVILKNRDSGLFDFSVNIIDSLGIISDNIKVKESLEKLIKVLKPANSRAFIKYTT